MTRIVRSLVAALAAALFLATCLAPTAAAAQKSDVRARRPRKQVTENKTKKKRQPTVKTRLTHTSAFPEIEPIEIYGKTHIPVMIVIPRADPFKRKSK